jgi:hypothetical protein
MNGELVKWSDAKVPFLTHALHYGTGVFEGIRCFKTLKGPAVFRLKEVHHQEVSDAEGRGDNSRRRDSSLFLAVALLKWHE